VADENGGLPFRVTFLDTADEKLRAMARRAAARGLTTEFIRDLRFVRRRLQADPVEWGDPQFDYRHLRMTRFRGRSDFFYTYFSVSEEARAVFVQDFDINPYSALSGDG
jgi:hypothetical protein